ncbi:MAG: hypothetical protein ABIH34_01650, partial [Nanoarchaeota archaeon]
MFEHQHWLLSRERRRLPVEVREELDIWSGHFRSYNSKRHAILTGMAKYLSRQMPKEDIEISPATLAHTFQSYVGTIGPFFVRAPLTQLEDVFADIDLDELNNGIYKHELADYVREGGKKAVNRLFDRELHGQVTFRLPNGDEYDLGSMRLAHANDYEGLFIDYSFHPRGKENRILVKSCHASLNEKTTPPITTELVASMLVAWTFQPLKERVLALAREYLIPNPDLPDPETRLGGRSFDVYIPIAAP